MTRLYIEAAIVVILVAIIGVLKLTLVDVDNRLSAAKIQIADYKTQVQALTQQVQDQNEAVDKMRQDAAQRELIAQEALSKASKAADAYKAQAATILNAKGQTCEDARRLILKTLK